MLVKRFVPRALMQQRQQTTLLDDLLEVVGSVGYLLVDPTFSSAIANVSSERNFWRNLFFYHSKKMRLKEVWTADKLAVALQESLVQNKLFDVRGYGTKVQYSKIYGTSFTWIDIPNIKIKYKWNLNDFDYTSCVIFKGLSSSVYSKLKAHDFYLSELNQALKKVRNCTMLAPKLNGQGALVYPLVDNASNDRLVFNNVNDVRKLLMPYKNFEVPLTSSISYNPANFANVLLAGKIGGGKTYTCVALACEMALQGYEISIIDGKDADLAFLVSSFLPSSRTATTGESALKLLKNYVKDMDSRYTKMKKIRKEQPKGHILTDFRSFHLKPKMLFIDEFASILTQLDNKQAKEATYLLKQLVLKNRQSGCFLCLSTQQPNAKIIDTDVRDNLMLRIFMGEPKTEAKTMVFGSNAELPDPLDGKGVGFVQFAGSDVVQAFRSPTLPTDKMKLYELVKDCMKMQCTN
ncbi:AAA family ATPase [Lactobacillus helveticus]|uniref:AAA family ATPase n=1 Tax=Lactobacillus helveticus TaxID=1587 RepID=UPI001C646354|nr:AAA family ATPase [Lactobacillus helveticus]MBW7986614.1 AAA family ATPase [Lactobacillus helveticus]